MNFLVTPLTLINTKRKHYQNFQQAKNIGLSLGKRPPPNSCRTYSIDLGDLGPGPAVTSISVDPGSLSI